MPFFLCLVTLQLQAQVELVPNGSFEILSQCPDAGNQIERAIGWFNCGETPDLCNECFEGSINGLDVPRNNFGWQYASEGAGYADLCTYSPSYLYREFIGVPLNQPLQTGQTYRVSFKCSPGSWFTGYSLATNNLGIRFTNELYSQSNPAPIDNFAHLKIDTAVTDTGLWTILDEYWTADTFYQYLVLGNFFDDEHTDTVHHPFQPVFGYYYIDEVSVLTDGKNGIEETNGYPFIINLQNGTLKIQSYGCIIEEVALYDMLGQERYQRSSKFNSIEQVPLNVSKGMYVIMIRSNDKKYLIKVLNS